MDCRPIKKMVKEVIKILVIKLRRVSKTTKKTRKSKQPIKKEEKRLKRQFSMNLANMLEILPKECDYGVKKNSKGVIEIWSVYKLHLDVDDRDALLSFALTYASTPDSQVAIPLKAITA